MKIQPYKYLTIYRMSMIDHTKLKWYITHKDETRKGTGRGHHFFNVLKKFILECNYIFRCVYCELYIILYNSPFLAQYVGS